MKHLLTAALALLLISSTQAHPNGAHIIGCAQQADAAGDWSGPWRCYVETQGRQLTDSILWAMLTTYTPEARLQIRWATPGEVADVSIALPSGNRYVTLIRSKTNETK